MNIDKKKGRYFRTSSFYISCYLFAMGLELVNIDRTNPQRAEFVFIDIPEREMLMESYNYARENSPEVKVDARKFVWAIKTLKDKLYQQ